MKDILHGEYLKSVVAEDFAHQLLQFLPEGQQTTGDLLLNLFSAQFSEALRELDSVIYSDSCVDFFKSVGYWDADIFASAKDPVEAFIKMVLKKNKA